MTHDYYGTKRVTAWPSPRPGTSGARTDDHGYSVKYEDGYMSWSPKNVFEEAYYRTDAMLFGHAIEAMTSGWRVARAGWNGKGMFVFCVPGGSGSFSLADVHIKGDSRPYIAMKTADGAFVPWIASQSDILADDWMLIKSEDVCEIATDGAAGVAAGGQLQATPSEKWRPELGDVVQLKSGGAAMTVVGDACCGLVAVAWSDVTGDISENEFEPVCLRPYSGDPLPF